MTKKIILWLIIGATGIYYAKCALSLLPPSDSSMIQRLDKHYSSYIQLLKMLSVDDKIGTISSDFVFAIDRMYLEADAAALGITEGRLVEYRRILKEINVIRLDRTNHKEAYFSLWASGFAGKTHHKSIVWLKEPTSDEESHAFKHIRENWYIFEN
jgi:hypothetical protein